MVESGAASIDAGVEARRGLDVLMAEQLPDQLEGARGVVEEDLCGEVAELMGRNLDAGVLPTMRWISLESVCGSFGVPSGLTKRRSSFRPMTSWARCGPDTRSACGRCAGAGRTRSAACS